MGKIANAPKTIPFTRDGNIACTFVDCEIADSKWASDDPNAFDVCLKLKAKDTDECDWWRGEMSSRYIEKGNNAGKQQWQMTLATLEKLGVVNDVTLIAKLIGHDTVAWIKKSESKGKTYFNIASPVSGDFEPEAIDTSNLQQRMTALMNPQTTQQPVAAAAFGGGNGGNNGPFGQTTTPFNNPFAKPTK